MKTGGNPPHWQRPDALFQHGSGVTGEGMRQYLREVLAAHSGSLNPDVEINALLGLYLRQAARPFWSRQTSTDC